LTRGAGGTTIVVMEFKRLFTRQEAESALPLVRRIVADVLETGRSLSDLPEGHADIPRLQGAMEDLLLELEEMGCYYKDWNFEIGLVDFPAEIDGETVFLCWRSDEDDLSWYHPVYEGYQGRRPLPDPSPVE
jgi:hypothetical protein